MPRHSTAKVRCSPNDVIVVHAEETSEESSSDSEDLEPT